MGGTSRTVVDAFLLACVLLEKGIRPTSIPFSFCLLFAFERSEEQKSPKRREQLSCESNSVFLVLTKFPRLFIATNYLRSRRSIGGVRFYAPGG